MRSALINTSTNKVENVIMADPAIDPAPEGFVIVGLEDTSPVTFNWTYNPSTKTFTPAE